ncbi:pyridoxamine 5'-phosphate oxidase family protein [Niallia sp. Krafla_26]|uniref:pyridoxamine 5'-phosphate oxidase family protein n=1 Tax=Niallia sp. Krafla_26 TaxID=3064703 RepID=UPI003D186C83
MNELELKEKVIDILSDHKTGILASVEDNKPHCRYMTFYNEELTLYTPTKKDTEKTAEIEKNSSVSVLLGYEDKGQSDGYVELLGNATINEDQSLKERFWEESFAKWFDGPHDPNYIFLEIKPKTIRLLNLEDEPPQELNLE